MSRFLLSTAVLIGLILLILSPVVSRKDPKSGQVRVLYVGDLIRPSPYPVLESEPFIDVRPAWPVGDSLTMPEGMAKKAFRRYIPRTYKILAENDVIIIDNPDVTIFEGKHLVWFRDAVIGNGSGLVNDRG